MTIRSHIPVLVMLMFSANAQPSGNGEDCAQGTPIRFQENGLWGYVTTSGIIIPAQFPYAGSFSSGVATVCTVDSCGLIDTTGRFATPYRERQVAGFGHPYSEGVGAFMKDGNWGYADLSGNTVIPPKFEYAGTFDHGLARVRLSGKFFFINHKGTRVTPEFSGAFDFSNGLAAVVIGQNVGYIRANGKLAFPPIYQGASGNRFSEGLVAFRVVKNVGFMDTKGRIVIKPYYDDAYPFSEDRAAIRLGDKWGYIDTSGDVVIEAQYHIAGMFTEGVASVQLVGERTEGGKWGFIDRNGAFAIPPMFDAAMPFCAGLARVETYKIVGRDPFCRSPQYRGKHGLINHAGEYVWREQTDQLWNSPVCF